MKEVAHTRVVAVAEHGLALEMRLVVLQLVLYINELGVELILLGFFGRVQVIVLVGHFD